MKNPRLKYLDIFRQQKSPFDAYEMMKKGDTLVTFCFHMDEGFNPSFLNNSISNEFTDRLIQIRNRIVLNEFPTFNLVLRGFKSLVFIVKNKNSLVEEKQIGNLKKKLTQGYTLLCEKELKKKSLSAKQRNSIRIFCTKLKKSKNFLGLSLGFSKVEDSSSYISKRYYLMQTLIDARISKYFSRTGDFKSRLRNVLQEVKLLAKKLSDERVIDEKGQAYRLFLSDSFNNYKLNPGLVYLVEKGKITVQEDYLDNLEKFKKYLNLIRVLAVTMYHTADDLREKEFLKRIQGRNKILKLLNSKAPFDQSTVEEFLSKDFDMPELLSKFGFESKLIGCRTKESASLLLFDAKNLGIRDILDCEEIARGILEKNFKDFEKILVQRGDNVTKRLREDILRKKEILQEAGFYPYISRRGDSIYIYVKNKFLPKKVLQKLLSPLNTTYRLSYLHLPKHGIADYEEYEKQMENLSTGEVFYRDLEKKGKIYSDFFVEGNGKKFKVVKFK
jgi:hypothetical protein